MTWDARDVYRQLQSTPRDQPAPPPQDTPQEQSVAMPSHLLGALHDELHAEEQGDTMPRYLQEQYRRQGWHTPRDVARRRRLMTRGITPMIEETDGTPWA